MFDRCGQGYHDFIELYLIRSQAMARLRSKMERLKAHRD